MSVVGRDEPDVGDDDPGGLLGVGELAEDDERLGLHRAADEDRLLDRDLRELGKHVGDLGVGGAVEHDAHRALLPVLGDQHDRAGEVRVAERRRGDQQLSAQRVHAGEASEGEPTPRRAPTAPL